MSSQDLRREVSQLQREESKQLQAKQLLEKAPKKMSKKSPGGREKNRMELLPLPFSRFSTCIINKQKARCVFGYGSSNSSENRAQDIEHLRRALKQRRNAEKERLGSKGWEVAGWVCQWYAKKIVEAPEDVFFATEQIEAQNMCCSVDGFFFFWLLNFADRRVLTG